MKKTLSLGHFVMSHRDEFNHIAGIYIFERLQSQFGLYPNKLQVFIQSVVSGKDSPTFEMLRRDALLYFAEYVDVLEMCAFGNNPASNIWYSNTPCSNYMQSKFYRVMQTDYKEIKDIASRHDIPTRYLIFMIRVALPQVVGATFDEGERLRQESLAKPLLQT